MMRLMIRINWQQIAALFILAMPIAAVARTVVFEEIFREPREFCERMSKACRSTLARKFFYLFTCEYCFSHWATLLLLILTALGPEPGFRLLYDDWRGYVISFFSLVLVANVYLNVYAGLRVDLTSEKKNIEVKEKEIEVKTKEIEKLEAETADSAEAADAPRRRAPTV